ncbi:radical SAM protein [candidate division WS5 bacterium]|uniref:Radical SAM protein n=1 Tax=candidate division WS5 bacterium TaxID=2093353 RepID=A0A419DAZ5_9BACT|nr:MAG: radical SAM protein [candidate division WS5 bacterium]
MKIIETEAKNLLTKTGIPGADWVINQYVGCQFGCLYCYAKFMCRFKPREYGKWGTWVEAKANAVHLIKDKEISGRVFMSSVSDPYQPIERKLELTREILKSLDKNAELSILTKSDLVTRDIDILKQFKNVEVGLTINTFSTSPSVIPAEAGIQKPIASKSIFEPYSPPSERRIEALKKLHGSGIKTYAFISPIIPGLIPLACHPECSEAESKDLLKTSEEKGFLRLPLGAVGRNDKKLTDLESLIQECKPYADYFIFELINVRGAGREFLRILQEKYPESYEIVTDKKQFNQFIDEVREIIKKSGVRSEGLHIHGK